MLLSYFLIKLFYSMNAPLADSSTMLSFWEWWDIFSFILIQGILAQVEPFFRPNLRPLVLQLGLYPMMVRY
jgi:hypothetical protein